MMVDEIVSNSERNNIESLYSVNTDELSNSFS
jgi:hypothetical protein